MSGIGRPKLHVVDCTWFSWSKLIQSMNRFIAFLKCSTKQIFFLPLSINTLFSETSVTHTLLLAGDSHFRAHLCIIKKSFCVIIFVLNDFIHRFMARPVCSFAVVSPVLNNPALSCALSLLGILRVLSGPSVPPPWNWSFLPLLCFEQLFIHARKFPYIPNCLNSIYTALIHWQTWEFVMYFDWFPTCLQDFLKCDDCSLLGSWLGELQKCQPGVRCRYVLMEQDISIDCFNY